jgi:transposase-like protein
MGRRAPGAPARTVKFTMLFTPAEKRQLVKLARVRGLTISDTMRQMIREALEGRGR